MMVIWKKAFGKKNRTDRSAAKNRGFLGVFTRDGSSRRIIIGIVLLSMLA